MDPVSTPPKFSCFKHEASNGEKKNEQQRTKWLWGGGGGGMNGKSM